MGLFDRLKGRDAQRTPGAVAIVRESQAVDNVEQPGVRTNYSVEHNELWYLNLGRRPHRLVLEVRIPGTEPYTVERSERVPVRATSGSSITLATGLTLPLLVDPSAPQSFEIDWKGFLGSPEAKQQVKEATSRESYDAVRRQTENTPGMTEQTWASATAGAPMWMQAVRDGKMKRKAFNSQVDTLSRIGQMDPDLAARCKAQLDAEGYR